ncbi:hypothetical protein GTP38_18285 [Duganella sp. FT94W]|uniref:Carrier domain-containing protein n=1 Tax=Duganella lactea TaxID=2692173 RepID=A0ABW9V9F6_9BURK|nr:hypothetical protein [Duganella lactea]MYM36284.1 hypothetical protein [Duganella lactea]
MDISHFQARLLSLGLTQYQFDELNVAAAKLPPGIEDGSLIGVPQLPGLTSDESEFLVARLLERLALEMGIAVDDPDLYDDLGFPTLKELVAKAQKHEESNHAGAYEHV